ncbi:hypothetical protein [Fontivita pretiosa]|uniref:hypothetical protein n=1 Tax=Fontivita pretiosa TaxID=2989684 RepID=UPI003D175451
MPQLPEPLEHPSAPGSARPKRSAGTWLVLIVVWMVGLAVWAVYISLAIALLARVF